MRQPMQQASYHTTFMCQEGDGQGSREAHFGDRHQAEFHHMELKNRVKKSKEGMINWTGWGRGEND